MNWSFTCSTFRSINSGPNFFLHQCQVSKLSILYVVSIQTTGKQCLSWSWRVSVRLKLYQNNGDDITAHVLYLIRWISLSTVKQGPQKLSCLGPLDVHGRPSVKWNPSVSHYCQGSWAHGSEGFHLLHINVHELVCVQGASVLVEACMSINHFVCAWELPPLLIKGELRRGLAACWCW